MSKEKKPTIVQKIIAAASITAGTAAAPPTRAADVGFPLRQLQLQQQLDQLNHLPPDSGTDPVTLTAEAATMGAATVAGLYALHKWAEKEEKNPEKKDPGKSR